MGIGSIILLGAFLNTIGTYLDKILMDKGISKRNYFYFMCLTMLPFSLISMGIEAKLGTFKIEINYTVIILLITIMLLRYLKQKNFVSVFRKIEPFELKTYMSLPLIICYIIDVIFKIETFSILKVSSAILIVLGVFLIFQGKHSIKSLNKDLFIRIILDVSYSYVLYFILKHMSSGVFIFLMNVILTLIFTPIYKPFNKENDYKSFLGLVLLQQTFGFTYTYITYYLAETSVTLSKFVFPVALIMITIFAFISQKRKKPTIKNMFGITSSIAGIILLQLL